MSLSYSHLLQLYETHPGWRLLRADSAPLIVSFVDKAFIQSNVRHISQSNLISKLEDTLYQLRQSSGNDDLYPRSASAYLEEWAHDSKGWLRKFYPSGSDEPYFDLTPATEKVRHWLDSLTGRTFIGTESRLLTLFELLRQMVLGAETDAATRIEALQRERDAIDAQITAIQNGEVSILNETALRDRFMQFSSMAKELLSDFRAVEQNFRQLDMQVREKIASWEGRKGELLEQIFGERDIITDSDQGKSFKAFWDFLMSSESQEEFSELLEKVFAMEAVTDSHPDSRLKRIHFDWLQAGEHTQSTVRRLSEQLRRYLDNQAYLENKRIMSILDSISNSALQLKHSPPTGSRFMEIDTIGADIQLPLERPLYIPTTQAALQAIIQDAQEGEIDSEALFNQVFIDKAELEGHIKRELQSRTQITLRELVTIYPLRRGLAELVCYLSLAANNKLTLFDENTPETLSWEDSEGRTRYATLPRIIYIRS